jgi:hypothetical protein
VNLIKEIISYLSTHGPALAAIILMALALAEAIVRLTPTTKDDTAVERIGHFIRKLFDMLKIPNSKSGGGNHKPLAEKESQKSENA